MTRDSIAKQQELYEIAQKYRDLKNLRSIKRSELERKLTEEMAQARAEFGLYLQAKVDRTGYPYKVTVADIMRAMDTTDRKTVNKYLGDARERAKNRYLDETLQPPKIEIIYTKQGEGRNESEMGVLVGTDTWQITWRPNAPVWRFHKFGYERRDDEWVKVGSVGDDTKTRLWPYGSDTKDRGPLPDWIEYALKTDEWKAIAPGFWK